MKYMYMKQNNNNNNNNNNNRDNLKVSNGLFFHFYLFIRISAFEKY